MKKNIFKELLVPVLLLIIPSLLVCHFALFAYDEYYGYSGCSYNPYVFGDVSFKDSMITSWDIVNYDSYYNKELVFQRAIMGLSEENSSMLLLNLSEDVKESLSFNNYKVSIKDSSLCVSYENKDYNILYLDSNYFILNISDIESLCLADSKHGVEARNKILDDVVDSISSLFDENSFYELLEWVKSLENSVYGAAFIGLGMQCVDKPVIYLYPEVPTDISVSISGVDLTTTYPEYNDGWDVCAYSDGTLVDKNNREYNYLYWEGNVFSFVNTSSGFVVEKDNLIPFLELKLGEVGLSDKEACDFISYWLPLINQNDYVLVSFQMENYEDAVTLNYSVSPDNELRLFVAFKGLDNYIEIPEQDLSYYKDFKREGFHIVEWGGTLID